MRQAFAPVGTRLRKAAATEDGGEGVLGSTSRPRARGVDERAGSHVSADKQILCAPYSS